MRWLAAAALPLLVAGLSGCVQVEVPSATAGAPTAQATGGPATRTPAAFPIACALEDEGGLAVPDGTCEWRFGALSGRTAAGPDGLAVRDVPAGLSGTVHGTAPGRASAQASVVADGPKTVRMTLPEAAPEPRPSPAAPGQAGNQSRVVEADANATENATVVYERVIDQVFEQTYLLMPDSPLAEEAGFTLARRYAVIEVEGRYDQAEAVAADYRVRITGPDGKVVLDESILQARAVATGVGGASTVGFPIGFIRDAAPGAYAVEVTGEGAPELTVEATAYAGLARDFAMVDLADGLQKSLSDYVGKVVVVDMMASWCGPCQEAMPGLRRIADHYGDRVQVLSVDVDPEGDPEEDLEAFRARYGVEWPIGYEVGGQASAAYGSGFIPTMVLVDPHGILLYRHIGEIAEDELRGLIDGALEG